MDKPFAKSEQESGESVSSPTPENPPKKKLCIFTKLQIVCALFFIFVEILPHNDLFSYIARSLLIVTPFLGIISLIRINLYNDRLKGRIICFLLLAVSCFIIYNAFLYKVPRAKRHPYMCGTNLKGLGTALTVYANDYNDHIPSDDWCDRLIEEADVSPKSYLCGRSDSIEGESDFYLNKYVAGQDMSSFPAKTVLMFEAAFEPAKDEKRQPIKNRKSFSEFELMQNMFSGEEKVYLERWNQIGGPDVMDISRHDSGCHILYVDGTTEFVKHSELSDLRWDLKGDVKFDTSRLETKESSYTFSYNKNLLKILAIISLVFTCIIVFKYGTAKHWEFILLTGILSAATGAFFGNMSEQAYISHGRTGLHAGIHYGLLVGLCYAVLMIHWLKKLHPLKTLVGFASSVGMATGIICATLVHVVLIIVNKETNCFGIVIGIPYGVVAGAVLGAISGLILKKTYKPHSISENTEQGATQ